MKIDNIHRILDKKYVGCTWHHADLPGGGSYAGGRIGAGAHERVRSDGERVRPRRFRGQHRRHCPCGDHRHSEFVVA